MAVIKNDIDKLLCHGYMRRVDKVFTHLTIPVCIWNVCYLYGAEYDKFCEHGKAMQLNDKGDTFTNIGIGANMFAGDSCYGQCYVGDSGYSAAFIYRWRFKIIKCTGLLAIGIVQADYPIKDCAFYGWLHDNWHHSILHYGDEIISRYTAITGLTSERKHIKEWLFERGNEVTISLDAKLKKIEYVVYDEEGDIEEQLTRDVVFCHNGAGIEYKIGLYARCKGTIVQMTSFEKLLQKES